MAQKVHRLNEKKILKLILGITVIFGIIVLLNIDVITHQGINYRIHTIRLPLYLKVLDFLTGTIIIN